MSDDAQTPRQPKWKTVLGATGILLSLKRTARKDLLSDNPRIVNSDRCSDALRVHALELARSGAEEEAAAADLRAQSEGHRRSLLDAAALLRSGGGAHEYRLWNRANRLLLRAADLDVAPSSAEEEQLLNEVDALVRLPPEEAFSKLTEKEPRLLTLLDRVPTAADRSRLGTLAAETDEPVVDQVIEALRPLVGPECGAADPLLRTNSASGVAGTFLLRRAGVTLDEEASDEAFSVIFGNGPEPGIHE